MVRCKELIEMQRKLLKYFTAFIFAAALICSAVPVLADDPVVDSNLNITKIDYETNDDGSIKEFTITWKDGSFNDRKAYRICLVDSNHNIVKTWQSGIPGPEDYEDETASGRVYIAKSIKAPADNIEGVFFRFIVRAVNEDEINPPISNSTEVWFVPAVAGQQGEAGKSAYEQAVEGGYEGKDI